MKNLIDKYGPKIAAFLFILAAVLFASCFKPVNGQGVAISEVSPSTPNPYSILDLQSSTKGFLPPRGNLSDYTCVQGMIIFDIPTQKHYYCNGANWVPLPDSSGFYFNQPFFSGHSENVNFEINNLNVWTILPLDYQDYNTGQFLKSGNFVIIQENGYYEFFLSCQRIASPSNPPNVLRFGLKVNGTIYPVYSIPRYLNIGDTLSLWVQTYKNNVYTQLDFFNLKIKRIQ